MFECLLGLPGLDQGLRGSYLLLLRLLARASVLVLRGTAAGSGGCIEPRCLERGGLRGVVLLGGLLLLY